MVRGGRLWQNGIVKLITELSDFGDEQQRESLPQAQVSSYAWNLRRRQRRKGDLWHLDEVFVTIRGERHYLWRAVDQDGDVPVAVTGHDTGSGPVI